MVKKVVEHVFILPRGLTRFLGESAFSGSSAANIAEDTKMHTNTLFVKYEWLTTLLQKTLKISFFFGFFYKIINKKRCLN